MYYIKYIIYHFMPRCQGVRQNIFKNIARVQLFCRISGVTPRNTAQSHVQKRWSSTKDAPSTLRPEQR